MPTRAGSAPAAGLASGPRRHRACGLVRAPSVRSRALHPRIVARSVFTTAWTGAVSAWVIAGQARRRDAEALARHSRRWARVLLRGWGVTVEAHGLERLPLHARTVLVPNHQSYIDVVALFDVLPEVPVFLAKKELRRIPVFGRVMETGGHVFVDRKNRGRALEAMAEAAAGLRDGCPLAVFPEGTRRTGPALQPFKKGAFHLARGARVPIVPIGIRGSLEAWPPHTLAPIGGHVSVHVGEPVPVERVMQGDLDALIAEVRAEVGRLAALPLA